MQFKVRGRPFSLGIQGDADALVAFLVSPGKGSCEVLKPELFPFSREQEGLVTGGRLGGDVAHIPTRGSTHFC